MTVQTTRAVAVDTANAVTSVVLCAQGHAAAVTGLMVGFGVAGYTGIIEQGIEQQQGPKPMTTTQNDTVAVADAVLDGVSGGAISIHTNTPSVHAWPCDLKGPSNQSPSRPVAALYVADFGVTVDN